MWKHTTLTEDQIKRLHQLRYEDWLTYREIWEKENLHPHIVRKIVLPNQEVKSYIHKRYDKMEELNKEYIDNWMQLKKESEMLQKNDYYWL